MSIFKKLKRIQPRVERSRKTKIKNNKRTKVRISNFRTLVKEDRFIYYTALSFVKISDFKESFHVAGKILLNRRNYCLIKITQDDRQIKDLKLVKSRRLRK